MRRALLVRLRPGRLPASRSSASYSNSHPTRTCRSLSHRAHRACTCVSRSVTKSSRNIGRVGTGSWTGSWPAIAATPTTRWSTPTVRRTPTRSRCTKPCELLSADDLDERGAAADRSFLQQGITFSSSGEEWVFPLDLVPRLIAEARVGPHRGRCRAAGARPRGVPRPTSTATARCSATASCRTRWSFTSSNFCRAARRHPTGLRRAHPPRRHRPRPRRRRRACGCWRTTCACRRGSPTWSRTGEALTRVFPGLFLEQQVQPVAGFVATHARLAARRRAGRRRATRPWCCSAPASTTRPTSSTPSWPARWASSWSRAGT